MISISPESLKTLRGYRWLLGKENSPRRNLSRHPLVACSTIYLKAAGSLAHETMAESSLSCMTPAVHFTQTVKACTLAGRRRSMLDRVTTVQGLIMFSVALLCKIGLLMPIFKKGSWALTIAQSTLSSKKRLPSTVKKSVLMMCSTPPEPSRMEPDRYLGQQTFFSRCRAN